MLRTIALVLVLATTPGCLAAAVGGLAYVSGKSKAARAETVAARMDYLAARRAAGATEAEIREEIKATDPEWYAELVKAEKDAAKPKPQPRYGS